MAQISEISQFFKDLINIDKMNIINLGTKKIIWKAKHPGKDWLGLNVSITDIDAVFVKGQQTVYIMDQNNFIRKFSYQTAKSKSLVNYEFTEDKASLVNMQINPQQNALYISNIKGQVFALAFDRNFKIVGSLKGAKGSIRAFDVQEKLDLISTCSLDRYLRIYRLETNALLNEIYLGQRLNAVLFRQTYDESIDKDPLEIGQEEQEPEFDKNRTSFKYKREQKLVKLDKKKQNYEILVENKQKFDILKKKRNAVKQVYLQKATDEQEEDEELDEKILEEEQEIEPQIKKKIKV